MGFALLSPSMLIRCLTRGNNTQDSKDWNRGEKNDRRDSDVDTHRWSKFVDRSYSTNWSVDFLPWAEGLSLPMLDALAAAVCRCLPLIEGVSPANRTEGESLLPLLL